MNYILPMMSHPMKYFSFDILEEKVYYMHKMEEILILVAIMAVIYMVVSLFLMFDKT